MKRKIALLLLAALVFTALPPLSLVSLAVGGDGGGEAPAPSYLEVEGGAYLYLREALLRGEEKIELRGFGLDEQALSELFATLYYSEAELFFVDARFSYARDPSTGRIVSLSPSYLCETGEIAGLLAELRGMVAEILDLVPSGLSDFGRVAFVHDYIAGNFVYDTDYQSYDVYSMLKTGEGVCQPYSLLARYLLRALGIPTECVTSDALSHEWNAVFLGGKWYHMDITWDDDDDTGFFGRVSHEYFLCSDEEFMRGEHASAWNAPAACSDTRYDGDFAAVTSAFTFAEDEIYAVSDGAISRYDEGVGFQFLYKIDEIWHTYHSSIGWQGTFSGLFYAAGRLLFNTETELWYYDLRDGRAGRLATLQTVGGYVYGIRLVGDVLEYALKREPNKDGFTVYRSRLVYRVDFVIGGQTFSERYLYGDQPSCKESTELPEDDLRLTFLGWDKPLLPVTEDAVYTALYDSVVLYPESAAELLRLVEEAGKAGKSLAERFSLLSRALMISDLVNPSYDGVDAAKAALSALISDYNEAAAAFCFAGWIPAP